MPIDRRGFIACAGIVAIGSACRPDGLLEVQADRFVQFRNKFKGTVILPDDADYDRARAPASFNPRTDKHPRFIARCMTADDIVSALEFAHAESLEVAVRSGGHDPLGASVCEGGIVIDLSQMKSIMIDREHRTARVEPGVRAGSLRTQRSRVSAGGIQIRMVAGFAHMIEEKDTLVAKSLQPSELFSAAL